VCLWEGWGCLQALFDTCCAVLCIYRRSGRPCVSSCVLCLQNRTQLTLPSMWQRWAALTTAHGMLQPAGTVPLEFAVFLQSTVH
jgi:hypothetical protein